MNQRKTASETASAAEIISAQSSPAFDDNAQSAAAQLQSENFAGKQIGNYRILREIGRGGMGAVFLAVRADNQFEQRVAVKVIRQTLADCDIERHFRRERQILASLNHPHIARLVDGGLSADGAPFFVMEYVEGEPLMKFVENQNLDLKNRLNLFLKISLAVSFAHRSLVVHRDLKPANILVTTDCEPKLLDFGLAKTLDLENESNSTQTLMRAATPAYAAPEQLRGEKVTTAADVYSLGVILYELLTARRPFALKTENFAEAVRAVCETTPLAPSAALIKNERTTNQKSKIYNPKFLKGDLDNIVLTALRKEPQRRYATVEQFADDIERYLKGLPVAARPATFSYYAAKFIERNKYSVLATVLVILTLIASAGVSLWQVKAARAARDRANARFNDVRRLSNSLLFELSPQIERIAGATEARQLLVNRALEYLDSLADEANAYDAGLQSELAAAYEKVGDLQGNPTNPNLGDLAGGIESYEKAQEMRFKLLEKNSNDFAQLAALAANHQALGDLRWQANELEESLRQTEMALGLYQRLAAERPDSPEMLLRLAEITYNAGDGRKDIASYSEAIDYFRKALDLLAPLRQNDPGNLQYLKLAGNCYQKLGNSLSWNGQQKEGETETQKSVQIYESLAARHPHDVSVSNGLWQTYWMASSTYEEQNDQLAHEYAHKALKVMQNLVAQDPADSQARKRLARTLSTVGQTSTNTGKFAEAVFYLEKAVAENTRAFESDPKSGVTKSDIGTALMRLAEAQTKKKEFSSALAALNRAEKIYSELLQHDTTDKYALRNYAVLHDYRAKVHVESAKTATADKRRFHQNAAASAFKQVVEILQRLDEQKSLPAADRQWLEETKIIIEKLPQG